MMSCAAFQTRVARSACARIIANASGFGIASRLVNRFELRRLRRVDDEDPIDELGEIRLDEQRHGYERQGASRSAELGARASADQRMQDRLEPAAFLVIRKDQRAERCAG